MLQLLGFFVTGLSTVIASMLQIFGRKSLVATATLSTAFALTLAFTICISELVSTLSAALSFPVYLEVLFWFVPSNFVLLISSILSGRICRAAYDLAMQKVQMINNAS